MSVKNVSILTTETVLLNAINETAILAILLCNTDALTRTVNLYAYNSGGVAGENCVFLKEIGIPAGDTFIWSSAEKFLLDATDVISAIASDINVVATLSYKEI